MNEAPYGISLALLLVINCYLQRGKITKSHISLLASSPVFDWIPPNSLHLSKS